MSLKYLKLTIGDKHVQITDPAELPISIDYSLEDPDNFQNKDSGMALDIEVPATLMNDIAGNTFRNPDIKDLTEGEVFRGNQPFVIDENGLEIMKGKAFLMSASHDSRPISYKYNFYGDNADWKIELEEATLYDFLKGISFVFSKANIINSWNFDGMDESLPYVFAPVRYRDPMGAYSMNSIDEDPGSSSIDDNMLPIYMKPSISKYWILYWAFKSIGYRIESSFLDSSYFRRQVMPWTWGSFLGSDGTMLDNHLFMAQSTKPSYYHVDAKGDSFFWDLNVKLETPGTFENNPGDYTYDVANKEMKWTYNPPHYNKLAARFDMQVELDAALNGSNSHIYLTVHWFKNGVKQLETSLFRTGGPGALAKSWIGIKYALFETTIENGDTISTKIHLDIKGGKLGFARLEAKVLNFQPAFSTALDGTIFFENFTSLKKYKFLDFLRGTIDEFNLSINTDPINKKIIIEPTHSYSDSNDLSAKLPGYFNEDFLNWDGKEDLSQKWEMINFSDYNREVIFKYKNDNSDGILKLIQDRKVTEIAVGKYVFPNRFKTGKKQVENRFFAATMHYDVIRWKSLGIGANSEIAPQMICLIPENVSNTSNSASANTFIPKSVFYKGNIVGVGAWRFDGEILQSYPYAFSVNYKPGGENDPILSFSDELINGVIGKGLLKRFYWQRLAIMRNGQYYKTWFRLKNYDVVNAMHREYKSYNGHRWALLKITGYKPLQDKAAAVMLSRWAPVTIEDLNNTFPSEENITDGIISNEFDISYSPLLCLSTDIPNS